MSNKLSPRQCRSARALLKWNPLDLASRCHIQVRRIEEFEHGRSRLMLHELKHLTDIFIRAGVVFRGETEVFLKSGNQRLLEAAQANIHAEHTVYRVEDAEADALVNNGDEQSKDTDKKDKKDKKATQSSAAEQHKNLSN